MTTKGTKEMCVNDHDPARVEVRPDGRRVCTACRDLYAARQRRHGNKLKMSNHRPEGETYEEIPRS